MKYIPEHVWLRPLGEDSAEIGITQHAQEALGDVVFVELPAVGASFQKGSVLTVIESVKAAADVVMPASAEVTEVNAALRDDPGLLNSSPLEAGWLVKVRLTQAQELESLLDEAAYAALV
jgi:glycine cleavage system H protein